MEQSIVQHCSQLDTVCTTVEMRIYMKIKTLCAVAHAVRATDVPDMINAHLEVLTELSYLTTIPMYRDTIQTHIAVLQRSDERYKTFYTHMVKLARKLANLESDELASDEDWEAWIHSM